MQNNLLASGGSNGINNPALGTTLTQMLSVPDTAVFFFNKLLTQFIGLTFVAGTVIFFFMFLWGAIQWISSGGDKQALEGARGRITSALVGLVILFASFAIIKLIEGFFKVHILTLDIGPLVIQ